MGYAVFAQRKVVLTSRLNSHQLREMMVDDIQNSLSTDKLQLQRQLSAEMEGQSSELGSAYEALATIPSDDDASIEFNGEQMNRDNLNAEINRIKEYYAGIEEDINQQVYAVSLKENIYDMEKNRLETQITKIEKEYENIEKSESSAIERSTPQYDGVG